MVPNISRLRNNLAVASCRATLAHLRQQKWLGFQPPLAPARKVVQVRDNTRTYHLRPGLTFTPYANPVPCNAHCRFCSEDLIRDGATKANSNPTSRIKEYDLYFKRLARAFEFLRPFTMGLSLSGLEATAEPDWFTRMMGSIVDNDDLFDEKVLYTNGSGFLEWPVLLPHFKAANFDRVELSRQHYDEDVNQSIMKFEKKYQVRKNLAYEKFVSETLPRNVKTCKNSCILTKAGINSIEEVERYVSWASSLGVQQVVFRELSRIEGGSYQKNRTKQWIDDNRVLIEPLLASITVDPAQSDREGWSYLHSTVGYYYYNEHFTWKNRIEVIFEVSSYEILQSLVQNQPNLVNKLIFHSNGNLTGDWEPNSNVIARFGPTIHGSPGLEDFLPTNMGNIGR